MKLNPDIVNSLNQNLIEIGDGWAWFSSDVYSPGYREILEQPLSLGTTTLDFISVKDLTTEITIRSGYTSASPLIYNGLSFNVNEFEISNHNDLNNIQGGSTTERYHLSASTYGYLQSVSANVQDQINTTNFNLRTSSTSLQNQIDTLSQQSISGMGAGTINRVGKFVTSGSLGDSSINDDGSLVKIHNPLSASGNISANSFVKSGGTSAQFLKANGSVDSNVYITSSSLTPYTLTTTTSAISANLQTQITNNNNSLSAYLPLSGGVLTGAVSANAGLLIGINSPNILQVYRPTSSVTTTFGQTFEANNNVGQKVIYSRILNSIDGAVSGLHSGSIYFKVYKNGVEQTPIQILDNQLKVFGSISGSGNITAPQFNGNLEGYKNVDNSNETTIANGYTSPSGQLYVNYRGASSAINEYRFWNGRSGSGAYSNLIANAYIKNGGTSAQFLKADGSIDSNNYTTVSTTSAISGNLQSQITNNNSKLSAYLPLSGGNLYGQFYTDKGLNFVENISALASNLNTKINNNKIEMRSNEGNPYVVISAYTVDQPNPIIKFLSTYTLDNDNVTLYVDQISANNIHGIIDPTYLPSFLPLSGGILTGDVYTGNLIRNDYGLWDIGTSLKRYNNVWATCADTLNTQTDNLSIASTFLPNNSFVVDLGSASKRFKDLYIKNTYSNAFETTDLTFTSKLTHNFGEQATSAATHVQTHWQARPLVINATSGDMYWSGSRFVVMDNTGTNRSLAYTSDLSSYTPTSGFSQTISAYLPLSGGQLTGQLRGTTISASGNITATNFVGNLEGYKNVDNSNETTIANGYSNSSGLLYVNYRGASSAINEYLFCNGKGSTLSNIKAAGSTFTGNVKVSAVNEGWSEGLRVMVNSGNWGGLRLSRNNLTASTEDNWAIGYANNNSGNLEFDVYTGGSQNKHTIFYKNGNVLHSGNLLFGQAGNGVSRGLSGDIGSSESWELAGKSSTTGAGDLKIKLYTSSVSQMVPFSIEQWSGVTPQNQITLMDASGNTSLNNLSVQKVTSNVTGNIGFEQSNSKISDTTISADNFSVGSSLIVQNTARTADKIKVSDNLVQMRNGAGDAFVQLSASLIGVSGVFLNVSTANPSYPAILTSDIGLMTSGFGVNGKTTYLKSIPTVNSADPISDQVIALRTILANYGLINVI